MAEQSLLNKMLFYMVFGFIFVAFCLLLLYIITIEITNVAEIPQGLESYIFIQRFSNGCFTYQDKDTLRLYPGIIDLNNFTNENLDKCYKPDYKDSIGFKLTINDKSIQSSNFDFSKKKIAKNILIFKEGKFENAKLDIEFEEK